MPISKSGKYFSNPARMRVHDAMKDTGVSEDEANGNQGENDQPESMGDTHCIEVHQSPEGGYKTVAHSGDTSEEMDHDDLESVKQHLHKHFGDDEGSEISPDDEESEGEGMEHGM